MNVLTAKNKQGFTIIEVVLVLAIAALIFLMIFIALPALQRNQRDTARKTILGKVASSITSYQSNNRGKNPVNVDRLSGPTGVGGYLDDTKPGSGVIIDSEYEVVLSTGAPSSPSTGSAATDRVQIFTGSKCNDDSEAIPGTTRQAVAIIQLENGDAFFCQSV